MLHTQHNDASARTEPERIKVAFEIEGIQALGTLQESDHGVG
jgi:hypothetical protein